MSDEHQHHSHAGGEDLTHMFSREFWDERYGAAAQVWSGKPNQHLVGEVSDLTPGTALDVGCGEGADVIWLAQQGWQATGADVSGVALERAAAHAAEAGVGAQTAWQQVDVFDAVSRAALPSGFDLVSAAFVHVPPAQFDAVYRHLADAVAPGGTLLVLAHHPDDEHTGLRNSELSHLLFTPEQVVALLDPAQWEIVTSATPTREQVHHGEPTTVTDTVVRARRLAASSA